MKKLGFTLAEVLITLVIIGVIAAMTVPTLMNNTQGTENKTAYKKAISSMNQALTMQFALEGTTAASDAASVGATTNWPGLAGIMSKRTNIITTVTPKNASNVPTDASGDYIFSTADGIIYAIPDPTNTSCPGENMDVSSTAKKYPEPNCGVGWVDVNGQKGPNVAASNSEKPQDRFAFTIYETKVLPGVVPGDVASRVMYDQKEAS